MSTIIVSAVKNKSNKNVQKYSNNADWNTNGGIAPNGVSATRYLRETNPDRSELTPLALWLVDNLPKCVAGITPSMSYRVTLFDGKTEAYHYRADADNGRCNGNYWVGEDAAEKAHKMAENFIKCYDLENKPSQIDSWVFSKYDDSVVSDADYWNRESNMMLAAGAISIRVRIGAERRFCVFSELQPNKGMEA